jgi:hypothetical protein
MMNIGLIIIVFLALAVIAIVMGVREDKKK